MAANNGDQRTIDIILRFLTDKRGVQDAQAALKQIQQSAQGAGLISGGPQAASPVISQAQSFKLVSEYMRDFNVSAKEAAGYLTGFTASGGKTAEQLLADYEAVQQFDAGLQAASGDATALGEKIDATTAAVTKFGRAGVSVRGGFALRFVGTQIEQLGRSILSPIQQYVNYAGLASKESQDWLETQQQLQVATARIGEDMIRNALPAMKDAAKLAGQVADLMDQYPNLAKGAALLGAGAFGIGGLISAAGAFLTGLYGLKTLLALRGGIGAGAATAGAAETGAAAAGGAGIAGLLTRLITLINPVTAGVGIGTAGYNVLAGVTGGPSAGTILGQLATTTAYGAGGFLGKVLGDPTLASRWALSVGHLTGAIKDLGSESDKAAGKTQGIISQQAVQAYIQYQQQETQAAQQYEQERSQIVEQAGQERAGIEQKYEQQRSKLIADFQASQAREAAQFAQQQTQRAVSYARQEATSEQDYYDQRTKAAANYNKETIRAEEDHQRQLRKLQEDHQARLEDLASQYDALGIVREMRSYNRSRRDLEETYKTQTQRRNQDYADQLAEMEANFQKQRERRMASYQQQLADQQVQYQQRRVQEQADFQQQLKDLAGQKAQELAQNRQSEQAKLRDLDNQYRQEQTQRRQAFADQLRDLDASLLNERNLRNAYYQAMTADLQKWLQEYSGQVGSNLPNYPGRQTGGYVTGGLWRMHDNEYVLNPSTTSALERMIGGKLTQANILASLAARGGGGGRRNLNVSVQQTGWKFEGSFTDADKKWFERAAAKAADKSIRIVLEAAA